MHASGRAGESASSGLTEALVAKGFETSRLKTGTPARVDKRTVDFSNLVPQPGDTDVRWFSFDPEVGIVVSGMGCGVGAGVSGWVRGEGEQLKVRCECGCGCGRASARICCVHADVCACRFKQACIIISCLNATGQAWLAKLHLRL